MAFRYDRTGMNLVEANKLLDDPIVEFHSTPLSILQVRRREKTFRALRHFDDVETLRRSARNE